MNKKVSLSWAIIITALGVLLTYMITFVSLSNKYNYKVDGIQKNAELFEKLEEVENLVNNRYINEINRDELNDSIVAGFMSGIGDKYARYLDEKEYATTLKESDGKSVGIGIKVIYNPQVEGIDIINVLKDSPAEKSGLLPGDIIYMVGEEKISDIGYYTAMDKLLGEEGSIADFTVFRGANLQDSINFKIVREIVTFFTVEAKVINEDIGFVRITEFNRATPNEFQTAMDELVGQGINKFVFDVRNNPGGDLTGIQKTLDMLLPEGPIIRMFDKKDKETTLYSDAEKYDGKFTVLINENSASAAELFCSALRDYELAILIGEKTYGKGTVQSLLPLKDRSGISVSTQLYSPPYGDNFEGIGVEPHIQVTLPKELLEVSLYKMTLEQDIQLQKAIEVLNQE